jgi:hypothetical protein
VRWWMPRRNRPSPPRSVTAEVAFMHCSRARSASLARRLPSPLDAARLYQLRSKIAISAAVRMP